MKELVEGGLVTKEKGETVLGALQRMGQERKTMLQAQQKAAKRQKRSAKKQSDMDVDEGAQEDEYSAPLADIKRRVDRLTTLAGTLLDGYGETDVYDWTFDDIVKDLRLEGEVPRVRVVNCLLRVIM